MMWEKCRDLVEAAGCKVIMNTRVVGIRHRDGRAVAVIAETAGGTREEFPCDHVVSSMPISQLLQAMDPPAAATALGRPRSALPRLRHRRPGCPLEYSFPDNWIYVHSKDVQVGRIQNFGSWSPYMVKEGRTCLGLEFFVFEGDETWNRSDDDLIAQGTRELGILGLVDPSKVEAGYVVRMPKAYPFYDEHYKANVALIVKWLEADRQRPSGRPQRHAPLQQPGPLDVHGHAHGREHRRGTNHDVWNVNVEEEYHEESSQDDDDRNHGARGTGRDAPVISRRHYGEDHPVNRAQTN